MECNSGRCFDTNITDPSWDFMGYSMLTAEGFRYTCWVQMDHVTARVDWTRETFDELYDLTQDKHDDFDNAAYTRTVDDPARRAAYKQQLQAAVESWY